MEKRDNAIDTVRGAAAFCVMWVHTGLGGDTWVIDSIILSSFFFVSGYMLKCGGIKDFIKNRVLKLLIPWVVICYVQAYINISDIKRILSDGNVFWEIGRERTRNILLGRAVWFIPALLVSTVVAYAIIKISRQRIWVMLLLSAAVTAIAYFLMVLNEIFNIWNVTVALIHQLFVVAGYIVKDVCQKKQGLRASLLWVLVYIGGLAVGRTRLSLSGFDIRNNAYGNLFLLYLLLAFAGIAALFSVAQRCRNLLLLTFMGRHSLLYFAFGAHGYVMGRKILEGIVKLFSIEELSANFTSLFVCTIASIAWILPAMLVDCVCPILNGKWDWKWFARGKK